MRTIPAASARYQDPLQAFEDQVEPEFERRLAYRRLCDVLPDVLREIGVLIDREISNEGGREVLDPLRPEGISDLPQRGSDDVAVEGVIRAIGQVGRESRLTQAGGGLRVDRGVGVAAGAACTGATKALRRRYAVLVGAEIALRRIAAFQSAPSDASSISFTTRSTMPSRMSSLRAT